MNRYYIRYGGLLNKNPINIPKTEKIIKNFDFSTIVFLGFGAVAKCLLTLMNLKEKWLIEKKVVIIDPVDISNSDILINLGLDFKKGYIQNNFTWIREEVTKKNHQELLKKNIPKKSIIIDLTWQVDTRDIVIFCQENECTYINTAIYDWKNVNSNDPQFLLKEDVINFKNKRQSMSSVKEKIMKGGNANIMTCIMNHGMNPGLVSHFVKYLLIELANESNLKDIQENIKNKQYNQIAHKLGLTLIQISERDTQRENQTTEELVKITRSTQYHLVCTWSGPGLAHEAVEDCQISYGTHEPSMPLLANTKYLNKYGQIILPYFGNQVKTLSYEPKGGRLVGNCIPHAESYSLVDFLRIKNEYRPTVYYSYLLPDTAKIFMDYCLFSLDKNKNPKSYHVLRSDEIIEGYDSVGCLCYFRNNNKLKTYWIGTIVDNKDAKKISNEINATCLQVGISLLAAILWMIANPNKGIIEPEMVDSDFILSYCLPYLGEFYWKDVTNDYKPPGDTLMELVKMPNGIVPKK
jgi:homospermidine synthase